MKFPSNLNSVGYIFSKTGTGIGNIRSACKVSVVDVRQNILQINPFFKAKHRKFEFKPGSSVLVIWEECAEVLHYCNFYHNQSLFIIVNPCSDFVFRNRENEVALSINYNLSCVTDSGDDFISLFPYGMDCRINVIFFWKIDVTHCPWNMCCELNV